MTLAPATVDPAEEQGRHETAGTHRAPQQANGRGSLVQAAEDEDGHRDVEHAPAQVVCAQRERETAQRGVARNVTEAVPCVDEDRRPPGVTRRRVVNARHQRRGRDVTDARRRDGPFRAGEPNQNAGEWRPEQRCDHMAAAVQCVGALPEVAGREDRKQRASADVAQRERQRRDENDRQQQRRRKRLAPRQARDQQPGCRGNQVVEHHEPGAPVAVEKRARDRRK